MKESNVTVAKVAIRDSQYQSVDINEARTTALQLIVAYQVRIGQFAFTKAKFIDELAHLLDSRPAIDSDDLRWLRKRIELDRTLASVYGIFPNYVNSLKQNFSRSTPLVVIADFLEEQGRLDESRWLRAIASTFHVEQQPVRPFSKEDIFNAFLAPYGLSALYRGARWQISRGEDVLTRFRACEIPDGVALVQILKRKRLL